MSEPAIIAFLAGGRVMVGVAQLARALDCGSRGRGFESRLSPFCKRVRHQQTLPLLMLFLFADFVSTWAVFLLSRAIRLNEVFRQERP